jgi:flagellar protein FliS
MALSTLAPGELLVRLYDELIKNMRVAVLALGKSDDALVDASLTKAKTIIDSLESYLNMQAEISGSLRDLYIFLAGRLRAAQEEKAPAIIEELIPLVRELRDSLDQADKQARIHKASGGHA